MAARKRKIAEPKPVAAEHDSTMTDASEAGGSELDEVEEVDEEEEEEEEQGDGPGLGETEALPQDDGPRAQLFEPGATDEPELDSSEQLLGEGPVADESEVDDTGAYLKGLLEALLFVSDHPLEIKDLARAAKIDKKRAEKLVLEIKTDFQARGLRLDEVGDGFAFRSNPAYSEYVRGYLSLRPVRLSRAQLETLSIVAYRQPITRPEVDDIRGVDAGPVLKGLLERDLVRIIGKKDEPGRPMLYGTTQTFLQVFSLKSLRDLPTLREFTELNDESRKTFEEELGEEAPEGPVSFEQTLAAEVALDGAPPRDPAGFDDGSGTELDQPSRVSSEPGSDEEHGDVKPGEDGVAKPEVDDDGDSDENSDEDDEDDDDEDDEDDEDDDEDE